MEFIEVIDIIEEVEDEETGEIKVVTIKSNLERNWTCRDLNEITDFKQSLTLKGRKIRNMTQVYHKPSSSWLTVKKSYNEMKTILSKTIIKGYVKN